jgi:hypothetical protein
LPPVIVNIIWQFMWLRLFPDMRRFRWVLIG